MVNYNPNEAIYNNMSIEDLQKEVSKPGLLAEDKSLLLHTIAGKRGANNNTTSQPTAAPVKGK